VLYALVFVFLSPLSLVPSSLVPRLCPSSQNHSKPLETLKPVVVSAPWRPCLLSHYTWTRSPYSARHMLIHTHSGRYPPLREPTPHLVTPPKPPPCPSVSLRQQPNLLLHCTSPRLSPNLPRQRRNPLCLSFLHVHSNLHLPAPVVLRILPPQQ
jgi:hypothetical protein